MVRSVPPAPTALPLASRWSRRASAGVVWLVVACGFFWRATFSGGTFSARDNLRVYLPVKRFWAEQLLQGHWPGWYPYDGFGQPLAGMFVGGVFHPLNALYLLFPVGVALKWNLLLAYAAAALGAYALGRTLGLCRGPSAVGAVAYAFSGYLVSISNNLIYLVAAATLPWVWVAVHLLLERPRGARLLGASAALALVLLAGDPQLFLVASAGVVVHALAQPGRLPRRALLCGGVLACAGLLGAVQLLPALSLGSQPWVSQSSTESALTWSGHPLRGLELLLGPLLLTPERSGLLSAHVGRLLDPVHAGAWVDSQGLGLGVVLLGLFSWKSVRARSRAWFLVTFALLGWLWLGQRAGLYGFLHEHLFLWRACRYPEKLTPALLLLLAVAAAVGTQALAASQVRARAFAWSAAVLAGMALLAGALEARTGLYSTGLLGRQWPFLGPDERATMGASFTRAAEETAVTLLLLAVIWGWRGRTRWRGGLTAVLLFAQLAWTGGHVYQVAGSEALALASPLLRAMREDAGTLGLGSYRIYNQARQVPDARLPPGVSRADFDAAYFNTTLMPDLGALHDLETANAYLPAANMRVLQAVHPLSRGGLYNIRYAVTDGTFHPAGSEGGTPVMGLPHLGIALLRLPGVLPRAYLARAVCVAGMSEALAGLASPAFRPGEEALVECGGAPLGGTQEPVGGAAGAVKLEKEAPDEVRLVVEGAGAGSVLVLNDAFYTGWSATVDGARAPVLPANGAVRAVPIPPGLHSVCFTYRMPGLLAGALVTLATLAALVAAAWVV